MSDLPGAEDGKPTGTDIAAGYAADLVRTLNVYSQLIMGKAAHRLPEMDRLAIVLPVASLVVGLIPALVLLVGYAIGLPSLFTATLAGAVGLAVTGARAETALASVLADFSGERTSREVSAGSPAPAQAGVPAITLTVSLMLRVTALAALVTLDPLGGMLAWLAAGVLSRSASLWLAVALSAGPNTEAGPGRGNLSISAFVLGMAIAALLSVLLAMPHLGAARVLLALALVAAFAGGWATLARRRGKEWDAMQIGGVQLLIELAVLGALLVG